MLEKEIKILLTKEEHDKLEKAFDFHSEIKQVNNYYRSEECAGRRISVRVREVSGKCLLQVKLPVSDKGSLAVREEIERELDCVPETIGSGLLKEICGVEAEAVLVGSLATVRKLCYDYEGIELALDENDYLGVKDYELEAEYTGEYPAALIESIKALGIDTEKPACGKYSRFLSRLDAANA